MEVLFDGDNLEDEVREATRRESSMDTLVAAFLLSEMAVTACINDTEDIDYDTMEETGILYFTKEMTAKDLQIEIQCLDLLC